MLEMSGIISSAPITVIYSSPPVHIVSYGFHHQLDGCNRIDYTHQVIKRFRHKGLKRFFNDPRYTDKRGINPQISHRLIIILDALDTIEKAHEMDIAGLYFHKLKGDRKDEYSVKVTGNWRITWRMDGNDVTDLNLEDYH